MHYCNSRTEVAEAGGYIERLCQKKTHKTKAKENPNSLGTAVNENTGLALELPFVVSGKYKCPVRNNREATRFSVNFAHY